MLEGAIALSQLSLVVATEAERALARDPGMTLMKGAAVALSVVTILLVGYKIFFKRKVTADVTTRWTLLVAFIILSPLAYFLNFGVSVQATKPVGFCNSCHVMHGHVEDLKNPQSEYIASLHYRFRWIGDHQCYECHSDYGIFGDAKAKVDGIRHFWAYYITGYETPLEIREPTTTRDASSATPP